MNYNIYCDESCHLENDKQKVMVLGAIWCPIEKTRKINVRIREIKNKHKLSRNLEIKWTKVSKGKIEFYEDIINYFFDNNDLNFRALIVPDKSKLTHKRFSQTHDTWYYKMYFNLLKAILNPNDKYKIYLDIKDTRSEIKVYKLNEILCNNIYDFSRDIIDDIQTIRSHEVEILQLVDLFIGAIAYYNRNLETSNAKIHLINRIRDLSGYDLTSSTLFKEEKFNLFVWRAIELESEGI
ncbi:MAG: DUF3800 domain-containing protein [Actinomycetota bacterium]|nr:DUF3800 domain-containing protein [Actinomycetota bacterium]